MGIYSQYDVYPSEYDDIDNSMCENCPYAHGVCWRAGYCIVEDVNQTMVFFISLNVIYF